MSGCCALSQEWDLVFAAQQREAVWCDATDEGAVTDNDRLEFWGYNNSRSAYG